MRKEEGWFTKFMSKFNNHTQEPELLFDPDLCSLCKGYQYFNKESACPSCKGTGLAKNNQTVAKKAKLKLMKIFQSKLKYNHASASHSDLSYSHPATPSRPRRSLDPGRASQWARNYNKHEVVEKLAKLKRRESRDLDLKNMQPGLVALYQDIHCNNSDFDFTDIAVRHGEE